MIVSLRVTHPLASYCEQQFSSFSHAVIDGRFIVIKIQFMWNWGKQHPWPYWGNGKCMVCWDVDAGVVTLYATGLLPSSVSLTGAAGTDFVVNSLLHCEVLKRGMLAFEHLFLWFRIDILQPCCSVSLHFSAQLNWGHGTLLRSSHAPNSNISEAFCGCLTWLRHSLEFTIKTSISH